MCTRDAGAVPPKMFSPLLPVELCTVAERGVPEVEPDIVAVERGGFGDELNKKRLTIRKLNTKPKRPISHAGRPPIQFATAPDITPGAIALLGLVSWVFDVTGEHERGGAVRESI